MEDAGKNITKTCPLTLRILNSQVRRKDTHLDTYFFQYGRVIQSNVPSVMGVESREKNLTHRHRTNRAHLGSPVMRVEDVDINPT